ncbi:MAG TPA: carotenoid biosynthesis protein [Pyrinomonadaceae bacterium]|nr:carotenoid biosynthesis protein [Pyrinomonadaceae bacterium]
MINRMGDGRAFGSRTRVSAWRRIVFAVLVVAYAVLWTGGVGHYLFVGSVSAEQNWLASAFLSLAGLIVLLAADSRRTLVRLVVVAGLGLLIELCGVRYGLPFGRYAYTGVLQPTLFGVPLVMAFAWMALVAYLKSILSRLNLREWVGALAAAAWMTTIDLVIDPLAANGLGYWRWVEPGSYYGIPLSNFAGWFVASLAIFALFRQKWRPNFWHRLTGASIVLFFTLIACSFGFYWAALVGFALCAADVLIGRSSAK